MIHYISFMAYRDPGVPYNKGVEEIKEWVSSNLTDNDYQWSYAKFRYFNNASDVNFNPIGILFSNKEDLLAFRLTFGI
jgi:hypothetical protein